MKNLELKLLQEREVERIDYGIEPISSVLFEIDIQDDVEKLKN